MTTKLKKQYAFTLAEVLITLVIIGIVAALTMPMFIQKQRTLEVENKLKKIYSTMNQAILMSETVNGPKTFWNFSDPEFLDKYILPFIKKTKIEIVQGVSSYKYAKVFLADGSLLVVKVSNRIQEDGTIIENSGMNQDYFFYPNAKNFELDSFDTRDCLGKSCFAFRFVTHPDQHEQLIIKKAFEPYKRALNALTKEALTSSTSYGCSPTGARNWCTALIQFNGWKIPDYYPFNVK